MRKLTILILAFFFLLAGVDFTLRSSWGQQKVQNWINASIQNSGLKVDFKEMEGNLLSGVLLKEVRIEGEGLIVTFELLKLRLAFFRLLQRKIAFSDVEGNGVVWMQEKDISTPAAAVALPSIDIDHFRFTHLVVAERFRGNAEGRCSLGKREALFNGLIQVEEGVEEFFKGKWDVRVHLLHNQGWQATQLSARSDALTLQGKAILSDTWQWKSAEFSLQSDTLLQGRLFSQIRLQNEDPKIAVESSFLIPLLKVDSEQIRQIQGTFRGTYEGTKIEGFAVGEGDFLGQRWKAVSWVDYTSKNPLHLTQLKIDTSHTHIQGDLEITPAKMLIGSMPFTVDQLRDFSDELYGIAEGKIDWHETENGAQGLFFDLKASDVYWKNGSARKVSLYSDLTHPFDAPSGKIFIDLEEGSWGSASFQTVSFETERLQDLWIYQMSVEGKWNHPFNLEQKGSFSSPFRVSVDQLRGSFANQAVALQEKVQIEKSIDTFRVSDVNLSVGNGTIRGKFSREKESSDGQISIENLPLEVVAISPLSGTVNFKAALQEREGILKGSLSGSLAHGPIGTFEGNFNRETLELQGNLTGVGLNTLRFGLKLPIALEIWPFKAELLYTHKAQGQLVVDGKMEEILDFFNLGNHRLTGEIHADVSFSNTLMSPRAKGALQVKNGYYQNYNTGTELKNIQIEMLARKDRIDLSLFQAQDARDAGDIKATGKIFLDGAKRFPFQIEAALSKFNSTTYDLVFAEASGKVLIRGNFDEALVSGNLEIAEAELTIPDRIPRKLPQLEVTYKNATKPVEPPEVTTSLYPLRFDLHVDAPDHIFISGRGLQSEWKGNFHVGGTQTLLASVGKIELVKGEFVFSGKRFQLTEGALFFSEAERQSPFLNLAGTMEVKDITITARLKGPLNNPELTFQSSPPLPLGTIMSYLLFGQDLSEINSFQALQIASSLASFAGEGPSVLEATRKSLGVDRLEIITVPSPGEEGGETLAVQVGKYVTEDVLVSFSQGAEDASTNITIEVALQGGLSLVLESQQAQEQGKFTLRWSKTY